MRGELERYAETPIIRTFCKLCADSQGLGMSDQDDLPDRVHLPRRQDVSLLEFESNLEIQASLIRHLSLDDLRLAVNAWHPLKLQHLKRANPSFDTRGRYHLRWDWLNRGKAESVTRGELSIVGIQADGEWQGLMALKREPQATKSRLPFIGALFRSSLIYVEYLETAPWNNPDFTRPKKPRYGSVGTHLLMDAVRYSVESDLNGRVGLHSLPEAVGFYRKRGMTLKIPFDRTKEYLPYLEYDGYHDVRVH